MELMVYFNTSLTRLYTPRTQEWSCIIQWHIWVTNSSKPKGVHKTLEFYQANGTAFKGNYSNGDYDPNFMIKTQYGSSYVSGRGSSNRPVFPADTGTESACWGAATHADRDSTEHTTSHPR